MSQYTHLTGVEVINDLYEQVSDIEIISVVSTKGSGGCRFLSYAFNWSEVDTVDSSGSSGNWESREKIYEFGSTVISPGGRRSIEKNISFKDNRRNYWMFKCKIGNKNWSLDKTNAMCNLDDCDNGTKICFTLIRDGSHGIRLNLTVKSGTAYFKMI